tara:strand:+ start:5647 stop:6693 length:1047 start_codon:yes stop_codon:yes gene_type:complete
MKVLITGGCGFLGSNIAASYLESNDEVIIVDALFREGGELNLKWLKSKAKRSQLTFHQQDIADRGKLASVFELHAPFDYVCHLGGQVAMTTSLRDPERDFKTNTIGTFNVLECARAFSPDALIAYSSTNKVYGDLYSMNYLERATRYEIADHESLDESTPLDFASPYGCSKGAADQYVRDWHRNYGLKTVVFRHSTIYGGRQFSTFDQGWIGWFSKQALEQNIELRKNREIKPFTIAGTGKQVRDVLHADDLVRLYRRAYEFRDQIQGEIFNIGGGLKNSLSLLELFALLEDLLSMEQTLIFEHLPRRKSDQDFFVADISKAQRILGWQPRVDCRTGVKRMLDWLNEA